MLRSPLRPLLRKPLQSPGGLAASSLINQLQRAVCDFTNGSSNPAVKITRSGLATTIGPDGTVQWGPHNLIGESDTLIAWGTTAPTFTPFAVPAFDGRMIGARFATQGGLINTAKGGIAVSDSKISLSCDVQRGNFDTGNNCHTYGFYNQSTGLDLAYITVNYLTGAILSVTGPQAATAIPYTKVLENGWFRIGITVTAGVSPGNLVYAYLGGVGSAASAGWQWNVARVMVNNGTSMEYVDSTVRNRLAYSNDFTNGVWAAVGAGTGVAPKIYPNVAIGPNGQPAALVSFRVGGGVTGGDISYLSQGITSFNGPAMGGLLIKTADGSTKNLTFRVGASTFAQATQITGAWQQLSLQGTGTIDRLSLLAYGNSDSQSADVLICDAQLNPGTTLWPYSYNPGAAPTPGPRYGIRTEYDPSTLQCKGALIEPTQVTQLLANPDNLSASPWNGTVAATDDGTRFRGRPMWKLAKTSATGSEDRYQQFGTGLTGNFSTRVAAMASSNSSSVDVVFYDSTTGFGATGDGSVVIESGPGSITQVSGNGSWWRLTGLSTNVPTVIRPVRNFVGTNNPTLRIYPDTAASTTSGRFVYIQVDNVVAGTDGGGSFIPNPAASGTVTRLADTAYVGPDELCRAWPWMMDSNIIPAANVENFSTWVKTGVGTASLPVVTENDATYAAPDGTFTADKVVFNVGAGTTTGDESTLTVASLATSVGVPYTGFFRVMGAAGTQVVFRHVAGIGYGVVTCSGLGIWDSVPGRTETAGTTSSAMSIGIRQGVAGTLNATATVWLWGAKLNPGPVAQQYFPVASRQGTIVFEGDLTYGPTGAVGVLSLENTTTNRVEIYKALGSNLLYGYVNANTTMGGVISSGAVFKAVVGFSPAAAGIVLNGAAEAAITPSAFAAAPNILKIGTDFAGNAASSMHVRRLRIFSQNLPASTKQSLTRLP